MDLYLKAADEAEMNAVLIAAGLAYEETVPVQTGEDEDGEPIMGEATVLHPAFGVSLDVIGTIPESEGYHVNVRTPSLTEAQFAQLQGVIIVPPEAPYRVWA
jgi:hypothetical protein